MRIGHASKAVSKLRRLTICVLSLLIVDFSSGCVRYHIYQVGGRGSSREASRAGTQWEEKRRLHTTFWGLNRGRDFQVTRCQLPDGTRLGFDELQVDVNLLAALLTLGIWVPIDVSYRCAKPVDPGGEL